MSAEKDILLICYYFPPIHSMGVLRNYYMANQFKSHFRKVFVLSTNNQKRMARAALPLDGLTIYSIPTIDYRTLLSWRQSGNKQTHFSEAQKNRGFYPFFIKLNDSFPFNLILGEGGLVYILRAYWKAKALIQSQQISQVYSSFRPYSDHVVAYLLKRRFPDLFWHADFRDLHIDENRQNVYWTSLQQWFNRRILRRADLVSTVSEGLAKRLQDYCLNEVYVLRNGISPLAQKMKGSPSPTPFFTIAYTGSLYAGYQSAQPLLIALRRLIDDGLIDVSKIRLVYAGKDGPLWQEWMNKAALNNIFVNKGLISLNAAHQIQQTAQINLLLSWSGPNLSGILTGKFYEYLAAQKPILLLINGPHDLEFEDIMDSLNGGLTAYMEEEYLNSIKDFVLTLYREWMANGHIRSPMNQETLAQYRWDHIFQQYLQTIKTQSADKASDKKP